MRFSLSLYLFIVLTAGAGSVATAQTSTLLEIDMENAVTYTDDGVGPSELADAPMMNRRTYRTFMRWVFVADVVAVNGKPSKGVALIQGNAVSLNPVPRPRSSISDVNRNDAVDLRVEILDADGTPVGTIMGDGFAGGPPAPGSPSAAIVNNLAIVGGTGAFLGARGHYSLVSASGVRQASMAEDPANRRNNPGGKLRVLAHLIPMIRPEVIVTRDGPAVAHSNDFSLVNSAKPARAGEILSVFATGLGPCRPRIDPGKPFPDTPVHVVNSPVDVTVNGKPAEVLAAVGYARSEDGYQVNFRIPSDVGKGPAAIRLSAAWIAAPEVVVPVE